MSPQYVPNDIYVPERLGVNLVSYLPPVPGLK